MGEGWDERSEQVRAEALRAAREEAVNLLGFVSLVIWATLALAYYVLFLVPTSARPSLGMLGGLALLLPAAVPWLLYPRLVAARVRRRTESGRED